MEDLFELLFGLMGWLASAIFDKGATGKKLRRLEIVALFVGWIAGTLSNVILFFTSWPWRPIDGFPSLAYWVGILIIGFASSLGGVLGARLAKDASPAIQIISAAFFGVLVGLLFGCMCGILILMSEFFSAFFSS